MAADRTESLSPTELEILRLVAKGMTNREIARERHISEATVKKHVTNVNMKLGTGNRTEAMRRALEMGLVAVDTPAPDGPDRDAARRLAAELERTRHRSKRVARLSAAGAVAALVLAVGAVAYALQDDQAPATPSVTTPVPASTGPKWLVAPSLPQPRSHLALVEMDGSLYAIGGHGESGPVSDVLRIRSPGQQEGEASWTALAAKPTAVERVGAAALRGRIVVPGGCTSAGAVSVVEGFDPGTGEWTELPPLPEPRCGYGLAASEGRLYLFGGRSGAGPESASSKVWRYDDGIEQWLDEPDMPQPRSELAAVADKSGAIHVLGGLDANGNATPDHWVFRPNAAAVRWDTGAAAQLPDARAAMAAAFALDGLYVVGGGLDASREAIVWDAMPPPGVWQNDPARFSNPGPPVPQQGAAMVDAGATTLVIVGGEAANGRLLSNHSVMQLIVSEIFIPGGRP